ncbi:MAG TPA: right-handed parallel beta-helix repeat-containing protein [Steroidobacter sp.]|uniref:right-handed parallel beta-helix repeat-containing protein n=1 Tax=Steroidobacter sp. TaxID=1978227 RepID=UPI002EDA7E27
MTSTLSRGIACAVLLWPAIGSSAFIPENERDVETVTFNVSPQGDDAGDGSASRPFKTLTRAQQAVRSVNSNANVVVVLADGIYRLAEPLHFTAADGGQDGNNVTWQAAANASPVVAGSVPVTGWKVSDATKQIYVAEVPAGTDTRQLWVDNRLAKPASIEIPRSVLEFDAEGMTINDPQYDYLAKLPAQHRIEVQATGYFTNRLSPVKSISGRKLLMQQPAWDNNTWGYDTLNAPVGSESAHLLLNNSLAFLTQPNQFYVDPDAGKLYYRPAEGVKPEQMSAELPRLPYLVSIGGTYERPIRDLTFKGIRFSYSSWMGPSSPEGYADQQSGAYLTGVTPGRPKDAYKSCVWGCRVFETRRNDWLQIPAAVQVSAAERIVFDQVVFAHLGQIGLGIGNNDNAHATGVGLGARGVEVKRSVFNDLAGGAILAGGISRDAHHPSTPRMANRNIVITNNRIKTVSQVYMDNSAILSTYVDSALILHNDISDAPYDGIDIGWGWGINDVGGNAVYRVAERGHYDHAENLTYDTPTMHRRVVVAYNRIYDIKTLFHDGGAIYNLSASPDTFISENYIYGIPDRIALYLDEGSRYITMRNNVVDGAGTWLNINTVGSYQPLRTSTDNKAVGNWHTEGKVGGLWDAYNNNLMEGNQVVKGNRWPSEAKRVMENAGIQKEAGVVAYRNAR